MYNMGKEWQARPSQLLSIDDPYTAWCLDEAVWMFGRHVDNTVALAQQGKKGKKAQQAADMALQGQLRPKATETATGRKREAVKFDQAGYRDPAAL